MALVYFSTNAFSMRKLPRLARVPSVKPRVSKNARGVFKHFGSAAEDRPVCLCVDRRQPDILEQLAAFHQRGDASVVAERLTRDSRIVDQLIAHHFAEILIIRKLAGDVVLVGQVLDEPDAVHQNHLLERFVGRLGP